MSMSVEMILRLIDQATGPIRGVEAELNRLKNVSDRANAASAAGGKVRFSEWMAQRQGMTQAREEAERYQKQMDKVAAAQSAAFSAAAARGLERAGSGLFQMQLKALETAREYQKVIQSITTAGGVIGQEGSVSRGILDAQTSSGVHWRDIAEGERGLVSLGGGEYLEKIAPIRAEIAKLGKASEAELGELYNAMYHYMHLGGMSATGALDQLKINFLQGQKGAYELKDLARGLPSLLGLGKTYGMTGQQIGTDIPALLQIFRKITGTPGEADTRLRHILTKLTDPGEAKKISKELGVDIYKTRQNAIAKGADPLIATLDAIGGKLKDVGGHLNRTTQQVEGADVKKLGAIARDYYFRAGIEAFMQMRGELDEFRPDVDTARKAAQKAFDANMSTADAVHQQASEAWSAAGIKAATPWLDLDKKITAWSTKAANVIGDFAEKNPGQAGAVSGTAMLGLWGGAGFMARRAMLKAAGIWAEGSGGAAAAATSMPIMGGLALAGALAGGGVILQQGILAGVRALAPYSSIAAHIAAQAAADKLVGGGNETLESRAAYEKAHAIAEEWRRDRWRKHPDNLPSFARPDLTQVQTSQMAFPSGRALPAFANLQGSPGGASNSGGGIKPQVDASGLKEAADEADRLKEALGGAANIAVSPKIETGSLSQAAVLAKQLLDTLNAIGGAASRVAAATTRAGASMHALHDGAEVH